MRPVKWIVIGVSAYAMLFQFIPYVDIPLWAVSILFILSPFLMIWMVYSILKHGVPSQKTFSETFYEDYDYTRNGRDD